jgi:FlaA1/EpsC-like NDP-sugar epimerase
LPFGFVARHRTILSPAVHILLFIGAYFCAFGLHFNFRRFDEWVEPFFLRLLPIIIAIKVIVFAWMNLYRGSWRYVGMRDLFAVVKATYISTFTFVVVYYAVEWSSVRWWGRNFLESGIPDPVTGRLGPIFPQSTFLLDMGMTIAFVAGARILVRLYHEELRPVDTSGQRNCVIIGAGDNGEALLREILRMSVERYRVVGFLDDDASKHGSRIHDVPILGSLHDCRAVCQRYDVEEIFIAMPGAPQRLLRAIVERVQGLNVRFKTIPAMEALIEGRVTISQIRDVDIKDLLGREQVELDEAGLRAQLTRQRVLVTGAGGSIGSELCRQVTRFRPERLILIERAENNLFEIDRELAARHPDVPRACYVADICDARRIDTILALEKPAVIFHAAAHKHVPMMETNVGESIKNNIHGTRTMADAARRHDVARFVMISTDKAVNPTSVMGCTKRVAEMYIQQLRRDARTQFMTVRFGNVLGSSGSVVPIFQRQIASGGPVTVTDPAMTRYFMTIPEATQLVMQAGVMGQDGDIFVLDMGEPVKIVDLAREMITLSGLRPGEDIEISFIGTRPGEKLYEELSIKGEDIGPTSHEKIYVWRNRQEDWQRICRLMDELTKSADELSGEELRRRLAEIVPEYHCESPDTPGPAPAPVPESPAENRSSSHEIPDLSLGESPAA